MPYMPTWNNPYIQQPMQPMQQMQPMQPMQPMYQQQPMQYQVPKVDGPNEAMNRLLMEHANQLNPGFMSKPVFDVDGKRFYVLSVEPDGRRNLETFRYKPDIDQQPTDRLEGYVGRNEFDALAGKVDELKGALDGLYEPVQPATAGK